MKKYINEDLVKIITGIRRCGKSSLLDLSLAIVAQTT